MKDKFVIFLLIILLIIIYRVWFFPGIRVANDFPIVSESLLKSSMSLPFVWSEAGAEGLGEYSTFFLWGWPPSFIVGAIANLGFNFAFLEKIIILVPILIIGSIGIWKICEDIQLSSVARLVSTFFYLANTYIILVIDGGQLSIGLAYAWFPISFLALKKSITSGFKNRILAGIAVAILGFFDIRFIYILSLLSLILFGFQLLFTKRKHVISFILNWIKSASTIFVVVLGLNFYWLYAFFKAPISTQTYQFFTQTSFLSFVNLGHTLLALSPHWFINTFGKITPLRFEFIFIPIIVLFAPILKSKSRDVGFWLIVAVISIFLSKGTSEPFPSAYLWLFNHLPGFSLFRDSTKFFFLIMISFSILIGISIDEIIKRLKFFKGIKIILPAVIIFYIFYLIRPVLLGQMTGTFSIPPLQKEYENLSHILENDDVFSRVFWIPSFPSLGYSDLNHPRIEAAREAQKRAFAVGTKGTYETFNFLREAPYMGEIFDVAGIGYIVYPYLDQRRDDIGYDSVKYYYTFLDQLSKRTWLSKVNDASIPLLKTNQHQDKFFITPDIWWIIGSDKILNESTKSANLKLAKNALIFVEEHSGLGNRIDELPEAKIVLYNKSMLDLAASFINPVNLIYPAKDLDLSPKKYGWWKKSGDLINWRDFLQKKYDIDNQDFDLGGGWAVGEGSVKLEIQNNEFKEGRILLARVMESTRSGQLNFYQNGEKIGNVTTKRDATNVGWFEIGQLPTNVAGIEINSLGDINVINSLAILDKNEWDHLKDKANKLQGRITNFNDKNLFNSNNLTVTYNKVNPTKYIISISNLSEPSFLVFSQEYNGLWKISDQSSFPVYSLLDGFRIDKDGQYVVEFEVQKYILPGLLVSGLTLISLIILLIRSSKAK